MKICNFPSFCGILNLIWFLSSLHSVSGVIYSDGSVVQKEPSGGDGDTPPDKVKMGDLGLITLKKGDLAASRTGGDLLPQLECVGGSEKCSKEPKNVTCQFLPGFKWICNADLPFDRRLEVVQVACEGYDHPDDPFILRGSCRLQYSIELTNTKQTIFYVVLLVAGISLVVGVLAYFLCRLLPRCEPEKWEPPSPVQDEDVSEWNWTRAKWDDGVSRRVHHHV